MRSALIGLCVTAVIVSACDLRSDGSACQGQAVNVENIEEASALTVEEPQTAVFRTEVGWTQFWDAHVDSTGADGEPLPPPDVDFENRMVIALFWGDGPYGGCSSYAEAIRCVRKQNETLRVNVGPLPDLGPCRMVVYPMQVIDVPRSPSVEMIGSVPGR